MWKISIGKYVQISFGLVSLGIGSYSFGKYFLNEKYSSEYLTQLEHCQPIQPNKYNEPYQLVYLEKSNEKII